MSDTNSLNLEYDVKNKKYIIENNIFSKEDFIGYIESDLLENLLTNEAYDGTLDYKISDNKNIKYDKRKIGAKNILLYGVPGSGKSHKIKTEYCNDETKITRIVFHPDYMNTDFIGQILPEIFDNGNITYQFKPGPFTNILKKAIEDPENMYYLIIEEINRGNAPAIFGEVFQLLDRDEKGNSIYGIKNEYISNEIYKTRDNIIKIPSNLNLLATMNTSDQNVFTLDTAFQRRWIMRLVKNDISLAIHADFQILDTGINWEKFATTINDIIISLNTSIMSSEDKRLGAYFITENELKEDIENLSNTNFSSLFAEKVIKYLWDDVFKLNREKIFNTEFKSLESIIEEFSTNKNQNRFNIFVDSVKDSLVNGIS